MELFCSYCLFFHSLQTEAAFPCTAVTAPTLKMLSNWCRIIFDGLQLKIKSQKKKKPVVKLLEILKPQKSNSLENSKQLIAASKCVRSRFLFFFFNNTAFSKVQL